jgi:hypothetical protein
MTWRLENSVVRGELFNLRPNHVHGWLELRGAPSLVHLGLTGNMEGELFGKRVQFETELADDDNEDDSEDGEPGAAPRLVSPDFEAIEIQQIGPTGKMQLVRTPLADGSGKVNVHLVLHWFSQNGEMQVDLVNPRLEFVAEDEDEKTSSLAAADEEDDGESVFLKDSEEEFPEFPDDADADDPYGLFPPQLEEQLEDETKSADIAAIDEGAFENGPVEPGAGMDDPLSEYPLEERPKRSWDEVIPGIDEQTKRLYESWDEIFEGKKDVPLCTIFDPPLTIYPVDKLSDAEVESAFKVILRRLAMHSVALDMCEHFTPRDAYRLLVEEILPKCPVYPGLPLTGYVQHYSTWEYCRKCDEEFEAKWQAEEKEREERRARGEDEDSPLPGDDEIPF